MKKSLFVLSVIGAAVSAHAQSSVSLSGTVDLAYSRGSGSVSDRTSLSSGGNATSKLIFRVREDLGGGMSANVWMEAGLLGDSGTGQPTNTSNTPAGTNTTLGGGQGITFNRRSDLFLASPWGEIHMGRLWNTSYELFSQKYDPFSVGVGIGVNYARSLSSTQGLLRVSNALSYWSPSFAGFTAQLTHYIGENPSGTPTADDGGGNALRIAYDAGPINAIYAHQRHDFASGDIKTNTLGFAYNFGVVRVSTNYNKVTQAALTQKGWLLGATAPVGVGEFKASYSTFNANTAGDPGSKKIAVGYTHNLSKRTALYGVYARERNSGGATFGLNGAATAARTSSSGFDVGIRHHF